MTKPVAHTPAPRPNTDLTSHYRMMLRIRTFEERVGELFVRGQSAGSMLHLSIGEESAAAGVCAAMVEGDTFTTHHRGHGIFLARGADPNRMMAEIGGKEAGYCHGKGGSMHIADMGLGHLGANAIVGGGIPAVVGAGLAARHHGSGKISAAFFGDGATGQGILYESMNMAALWSLPCLFVCINNQYGMGTRIDQATANPEIHERARAFGLVGERVDGLDVEAVSEAADRLVAGVRQGKPAFLMIDCYRFYGHARKDKSPYRDPAEEEQGRQKDPVAFARAALLERGLATEAELTALETEVGAEMDATIDFTIAQKEPPLSTMFRDVYAPEEPEPEPVRTRIDRVLARD
ncbi:thiamine pyrophosphate-dependent dehydrogenase E1 component subunit alpha [Pseudogemmobacter bohemicus]|uniref:thiamine pyrophosphate-dependent dehydrogenase E1 component subunit alpha n=1 Tax=Pseudogemmobacter bohemicus TaxID=2250708 RepID=UPI0018E4EB5F|nr:thiamine pyrophosphate-dependent enzyme [Pseudogemmobacter bohemicus]